MNEKRPLRRRVSRIRAFRAPESNDGAENKSTPTVRVGSRSFSAIRVHSRNNSSSQRKTVGHEGSYNRSANTRPNVNHDNKTTRTRTVIRKTGEKLRSKSNYRRDGGQISASAENQNRDAQTISLLAPDEDTVRIIPLGGVEEVGRNMSIVELNNDIFVIDCGFQFMSEADAPGIDYVLPNTKYLEDRKDRIKGVIITHGHLDHIGGIPYIMERIGNPPIYTRYLTSLMILKRNAEFPHLPASDIRVVDPGQRIKIGDTYVKFFPVTHSIPDSMGVLIETKHGNVIFSGDLKLDRHDNEPTEEEKKRWSEIGKQKNIFLAADSTNTERPGFSITEREVNQTLEEIIRDTKSRLIIGTFASQFERMIKIIEIADKYNKKVVTDGRSIKTNIEIAKEGGILKIKDDTIVPVEDIDKYPSDRIIILATGAQGEEFAVLMRVATKKHKYIQLNERDTIVLSSSVIPGNELSVQKLKDNLYRHNVKLLHYRVSDVHSTGHGYAGELVWINKQVNPKFFMPAYGFRSMLTCHAQAVRDAGFPKENIIIPDNGTIIEIKNGEELTIRKEMAPANPLMVDGFSIGDMQEVVVRDRQTLAKDGMFVIIGTINQRTGKLKKSPDIISRGFVYLRESQDLLNQTRLIVKKTIEDTTSGMNPVNLDYTKAALTDNVSRFLFQKTNKRPIVIPVLIGV